MRKTLFVAVLCLLCCGFFLKNYSLDSLKFQDTSLSRGPSFVETLTPEVASDLKYFGFFADGMEGVGKGDYIESTGAVANIHFVSVESLDRMAEKIKLAIRLKSKVILMLEGYFFDWQTVRLRQDYKVYVATLKKYLSDHNLTDSILGIYIIVEPYWKNENSSQKLTQQQVYDNLKTAATEVQNNFKSKLIISTEGYPILDQFVSTGQWLGFPSEYNWIAVNCYLAFGEPCNTDDKYENYIKILHSKLSGSHQHLIFTLDNYIDSRTSMTPVIQNALTNRVKFQHNLAIKYGAKALVSFLFQSSASDHLTGLIDIPGLQATVFDLATSVTQKRPLK